MINDRSASNNPAIDAAMGLARGMILPLNAYVPQPPREQFRDLQARQLAYVEKLASERDALRMYIVTLRVNEMRASGPVREKLLAFIAFSADRVLKGERLDDVIRAAEADGLLA